MLGRAVHSHASANKPKLYQQQPLTAKSSSSNVQKLAPSTNVPLKRKFDRSMSTGQSLGALHQSVQFDENDFPDDADILLDLADSPPRATPVEIHYPKLPSLPSGEGIQPSHKPPPISSSASVPWSSSPPEHFVKPIPTPAAPVPSATSQRETSSEQVPTKKRRTLPWGQSIDAELQASAHLNKPTASSFTPLPQDKTDDEKYPWNKTASTVKEEEKEMRKKTSTKQSRLATTSTGVQPVTKIATTHLSDEQRMVARTVVEEGKSVFFTGSAGTGKSVLMRSIISQLRSKYRRDPERLAITASTGLAACVIEGTTIHSWAGIGLGKEPVPELVKRIKRNAKSKAKWTRTKVLIIDEISMVDGELFDKLEQIARSLRNNGRPFGGIQLVVTGDFFQLPPVPDKNTVAKFAFDAATWKTCIEHTILLTHVFRQKDPTFANMLNEMRLGQLSQASINEFKKLSRPLDFQDEVSATELFPTRVEVDRANSDRMSRLQGQVMTYQATDSGVPDLNVRDKILANFMAPEQLTLKKGAQVMLIKNLDTQLVNGTLGKVLCFMDDATYGTYKGQEETYHTAFLEGNSDSEETKKAREKFNLARYKNQDNASTKYWPMVRFPLADGTFRDMLCEPEEWKTESQTGEIIAKRSQVPLILAWALSIHKAQGQTLSRVKVDLGKVFERGQAYVALSRATSQAGLQVLRFDPRKVMVHPKVITFYKQLQSISEVNAKKPKQTTLVPGGRNTLIDEKEELIMYG